MPGQTKFIFSQHAETELQNRSIPKHMALSVLNDPEQIVPGYGHLKIYQSRVDFGSGKIYLLRLIVDDTMEPANVITLYRTSKFEKYWRGR